VKIQILSDLHGSQPTVIKEADVIVCAGDIDTKPARVKDYFRAVRRVTNNPIIYVLGNHEYFEGVFPASLENYWEAVRDLDVTLLERATIEFDGVLFAGCTMWTDFDKGRGEAAARFGMNDFEYIRVPEGKDGIRRLSTSDLVAAHNEAKGFLSDELAKNVGKRLVVVTHHLPSFSLISGDLRGSSLNGAFAADMDRLITEYEPSLWIYGHTHRFSDVCLGSTRCVCNPLGYRGEKTAYRQNYLVEI
jgi:predicted phosphodiesterase